MSPGLVPGLSKCILVAAWHLIALRMMHRVHALVLVPNEKISGNNPVLKLAENHNLMIQPK